MPGRYVETAGHVQDWRRQQRCEHGRPVAADETVEAEMTTIRRDSRLLAEMHETARRRHGAGAIGKRRLGEIEALCRLVAFDMTPPRIPADQGSARDRPGQPDGVRRGAARQPADRAETGLRRQAAQRPVPEAVDPDRPQELREEGRI